MKRNDEPVYFIMYKCLNCGHKEELAFKKGQEAPVGLLVCPNCECERMIKLHST